jgi:hypothetical protein
MVVVFTTTYAIGAYDHWCCEFKSHSGSLCDKVCQLLATGRYFSLDTLVSSTNKTDRHDKTEILLKVALNTLKPTKPNVEILELFEANFHGLYIIVFLFSRL